MRENEFTDRVLQVQGRLYRTACAFLGDGDSAVEAIDEAVYRAFLSLRKLREPALFETWLTRILINVCKKELRRKRRQQPMETLPEDTEDAFDALPLREALGKLPPELRDVMVLRYFSGHTLAETAQALQILQGTAASRQRRALALLKLELSESEEMNT